MIQKFKVKGVEKDVAKKRYRAFETDGKLGIKSNLVML